MMFEFESDQLGKRLDRNRDRDLLRRFRGGDREAFAQLYRAQNGPVYRFARGMTGDEVKAAEITQDVFVWLIHHPDGFDPERGELSGFLVGVARKLLKRRFSEEQRWVPIEESMLAPVESGSGGSRSGGPDTELLRQAIAALPERYREVVVLCDLETRSYE